MKMLDAHGKIKPLAERLRQACQEGREILGHWHMDPFLYDEAADEIERLLAALTEINGCYVDRFGGDVVGLASGVELDRPARIARAALADQQSREPK